MGIPALPTEIGGLSNLKGYSSAYSLKKKGKLFFRRNNLFTRLIRRSSLSKQLRGRNVLSGASHPAGRWPPDIYTKAPPYFPEMFIVIEGAHRGVRLSSPARITSFMVTTPAASSFIASNVYGVDNLMRNL